jgi:hypothetical protein
LHENIGKRKGRGATEAPAAAGLCDNRPTIIYRYVSYPGCHRADYDPLRHPASSLAIGELGWMQAANFIIPGLLLLAFALGLRSALRASAPFDSGNHQIKFDRAVEQLTEHGLSVLVSFAVLLLLIDLD